MALQLLYFAWVREAIGCDGEAIDAAGLTAVGEVIDRLEARGGGYAAAFSDRTRLRAALDDRFVDLDAPLGDAGELALFPPVTGG